MITSFFPGRIRLRAPVFKDTVLVERALSVIKKVPGFINIENNLVTGSVLIHYDPEKVPQEKLLGLKDFFILHQELPDQKHPQLQKELQYRQPLQKEI